MYSFTSQFCSAVSCSIASNLYEILRSLYCDVTKCEKVPFFPHKPLKISGCNVLFESIGVSATETKCMLNLPCFYLQEMF